MKKLDWERANRQQKVNSRSFENAYADFPAVGSHADRKRFLSKEKTKPVKAKNQNKKSQNALSKEKQLKGLMINIECQIRHIKGDKWENKDANAKEVFLRSLANHCKKIKRLNPSAQKNNLFIEAKMILEESGIQFEKHKSKKNINKQEGNSLCVSIKPKDDDSNTVTDESIDGSEPKLTALLKLMSRKKWNEKNDGYKLKMINKADALMQDFCNNQIDESLLTNFIKVKEDFLQRRLKPAVKITVKRSR